MAELENIQRTFEKILSSEKQLTEQIRLEKEQVERESRDLKTKLLSLNREIEELLNAKKCLKDKLNELVNSQGEFEWPVGSGARV